MQTIKISIKLVRLALSFSNHCRCDEYGLEEFRELIVEDCSEDNAEVSGAIVVEVNAEIEEEEDLNSFGTGIGIGITSIKIPYGNVKMKAANHIK
ncbi:hypothetical protein QR98_0038320 [Sarcoptes scabiei]|uniref:Uncharacterized protein n=1 Tax=Sarcoptes scabiei TaxID=52283 RepID=A0A132A4Q1_SARSC|nr:hypothetical protein QR98_0038320 [Sarcoptes scabiei]